jgi:hypothetical protein
MKKSLARLNRKKGKMIFSLKTRLTVLLLFSLLCAFPSFTGGQPGPPPHHPPGHGLPGDQKPHDTPLDSGLGILTLMGLVLIAQKTFKERRHNKK